MPWCGRKVKSFYLAGKITGTDWRDQIVDGWSEQNHSNNYFQAFFEYEDCPFWAVVPNVVSVCGKRLNYAGPWWNDFDSCGHSVSRNSESPHGYGCDRRREVFCNVSMALQFHCDLVFAWIDSADCYGTIFEIGFAKSIGKVVVVAMSDEFASTPAANEMWLLKEGSYFLTAKTPACAWKFFWECVSSEKELSTDGTHKTA